MADLYYIEDDYFTPDGYYVYTADAAAAALCESTVTCELTNVTVTEAQADLIAQFTQTAAADKFKTVDANITAVFSQESVAVKTTESQSTISSSFSQSSLVGKIVNASIDAITLFNTNVSVNATSSASIDLNSSITVNCAATVVSTSTVTLDSIINLSLQAAKTTGCQASITTTVTVTATAQEITQPVIVSIVSQFSQSTAVTRTRTFSAASTSQFTQTTVNRRVRFGLAQPVSQFTQTTQAREIAGGRASLNCAVTLSCIGLDLDIAAAYLTARFTTTCAARIAFKGGSANLTSASTVTSNISSLVGYGWDNIRSVLHFEDNLVDSVSTDTVSGSVSSYFNAATNFGRGALDPSNILINRTVGRGITTIGTQEFSYDVKLKAAGNVGQSTGLYSGILARFRDADDTDLVYHLEYEEGAGTTFGLRFVRDRIASSSRTTLVFNTFTSPQDSGDINYTPWLHIKLIRKNGVLYFYVNGVVRSNTVAFTANLGSEVYVARQMFAPTTPLPFKGKLDESCLRIGGAYSTADFTPPINPYGPFSFAYADFNTRFTSTVTGNHRVRFVRPNLVSTATVVAVGRRNIGPITAALISRASVSATVRKIARTTCSTQVTATTTTRNTRVRRNIVYLNTIATVSPNAKKLVGTSVALTASFTTNQTARKTARGQISLTAFNTVASASVKNATGTVTLESRATLNCLAVKTGEVVVQSVSIATTTASFLKQPQPRQYSFALGMTATMAVTARKTVNPQTYITATTTANINATYISVNTFPMSAAFTVTADVIAGYLAISNQQVSVTVTADTLRSKTMYGVINIQAFGTEVVIGTKVTIDPYLTLWVPPETSAKKVTQETALLTVDSENRVNIITQEQRTILVPTETSTWHLPTAKVVGVRRIK